MNSTLFDKLILLDPLLILGSPDLSKRKGPGPLAFLTSITCQNPIYVRTQSHHQHQNSNSHKIGYNATRVRWTIHLKTLDAVSTAILDFWPTVQSTEPPWSCATLIQALCAKPNTHKLRVLGTLLDLHGSWLAEPTWRHLGAQ